MSKVKKGDTIKVHYTGTLQLDGSLFDTSEGREPLEFTVGEGMVIHGFDQGVLDMSIGEKKKIEIPFLQGYGPINEQMILEFEKSQFPEDMGTPEVGAQLHLMDNQGNQIPVVITEVKEETIMLDANHPLAGKDLIFEVELVEIV